MEDQRREEAWFEANRELIKEMERSCCCNHSTTKETLEKMKKDYCNFDSYLESFQKYCEDLMEKEKKGIKKEPLRFEEKEKGLPSGIYCALLDKRDIFQVFTTMHGYRNNNKSVKDRFQWDRLYQVFFSRIIDQYRTYAYGSMPIYFMIDGEWLIYQFPGTEQTIIYPLFMVLASNTQKKEEKSEVSISGYSISCYVGNDI